LGGGYIAAERSVLNAKASGGVSVGGAALGCRLHR